ncbi:MAG: glycosyltransferase family 4 protein [Bacteroidota bacterium]
MKSKLLILSSHPIQYNAPFFQLIAERNRIDLKVFYTWSQSREGELYDPGFAKAREWDLPLLEGYHYEFVENTARDPGSHHFLGIVNPRLIKMIEAYNPDAILVYGWSFYSHLNALRHFKGKIPILFRGDSTLLDDAYLSSIKKWCRKVFLSCVYRHVDKAFYVGQANKQYFLANGLNENQLIFAPHSIDNRRFSGNNEFYEEQALLWRRELGIPHQSIVFLFAGKLEPKKNPFLLIDIFQSLSDENIRLIIAGNGVLEKELKDKAKSDPRILFIDFQNQSRMPMLYRMGDIFVLPSLGPGETWGLSVNEAMACGRPAIVSDSCGCCQDLIIEGKTGYSFTSGNHTELRECMQLFIINKNKNSFRVHTRSHIANYNLESVAIAIENELLNKA